MAVTLHPLQEADLLLLHTWLNEPHLRPFYTRQNVSLESVAQKYGPRIRRDHSTKCLIAREKERPFGYMQWYLNRSYPDYGAAIIGRSTGVSIDYFIGDKAFLGRRLGSEMLRALVCRTLPKLEPEDRIFCIGHDNENLRAIRCTTRSGFAADRDFLENERWSTLFVRNEVP